MSDVDQIFLSEEILALMRNAAAIAQRLKEPFITTRTLLVALLDDPALGEKLVDVLPREKLEAYELPAQAAQRLTASRVQESKMPPGERAALLRFNTLAFKLPDGSKSVWLSREAYQVWNEGAKRVEDGAKYMPKHLAFGIAADAVRSPGVLTDLRVSPGDVSETILTLE
ncbi:MAG TPA: hypothetical protein VNF68_15080 [Candidatus Baltobacteraceae bacterium]|nr:hypothetical protein [Candidatus Baltobacteraceae bacterium]